MNKKMLIQALAEKTGFSEKDCQKVLDAHNAIITDTLSNREDVKIVGFGIYTTHLSKGRMGRNPKTGEPVEIKDKFIPKFKAGKLLKDSVHENNIIS